MSSRSPRHPGCKKFVTFWMLNSHHILSSFCIEILNSLSRSSESIHRPDRWSSSSFRKSGNTFGGGQWLGNFNPESPFCNVAETANLQTSPKLLQAASSAEDLFWPSKVISLTEFLEFRLYSGFYRTKFLHTEDPIPSNHRSSFSKPKTCDRVHSGLSPCFCAYALRENVWLIERRSLKRRFTVG